jgi:dTDP-4-amino-4,6-dideoxygalactose transaminase
LLPSLPTKNLCGLAGFYQEKSKRHLEPVFKYVPFFGNGTSEKLFDQGLCLPSGSNMTEEDVQRIKEVLVRVFV